jgi:hypothetical protein
MFKFKKSEISEGNCLAKDWLSSKNKHGSGHQRAGSFIIIKKLT